MGRVFSLKKGSLVTPSGSFSHTCETLLIIVLHRVQFCKASHIKYQPQDVVLCCGLTRRGACADEESLETLCLRHVDHIFEGLGFTHAVKV